MTEVEIAVASEVDVVEIEAASEVEHPALAVVEIAAVVSADVLVAGEAFDELSLPLLIIKHRGSRTR